MSPNNDDIHPDILDAVDSLLEEIEETTQAFTPDEEKELDTSALVADVGTIVAEPEPEPATESIDTEPDAEPDAEPVDEPIDSIENAKQALDALDEVESQAEELVAQSIDALLEDAETETDAAAEAEIEPELEAEVDVEAEAETEELAEAESTDEEIDTDELLASIDDLLEQSDTDTQEEEHAETEPEEVAEAIVADEVILEDTVEDTVEDAIEETAEEIAEVTTPEPTAESVNEDFESELVAESLDASSDALDDSMDMLDSALSEAADDMLDGDFETEEGELVTGEAVASAIEEALEAEPKPGDDGDLLGDAADDLLGEDEPAPKPDAEPDSETAAEPVTEPTPEPVAKKAEDKAPEPEPVAATVDIESQDEIEALEETHANEPTPVPVWFERSVEIIRPKIDKIDPLKGKTMDALAMVLGTIIVAVMTHATPIVAKIVVLVSKPLAKQSPEVRNAVGYIALWTGFLAVVLWVYLLMFRTPSIPHPESAPTRVISADESVIIQPVIKVLP